jgi:tetratricopeptide (TPR) repeat protein
MISRFLFQVPHGTTGIILEAGKNEFHITPQPNLSNLFHNRRVITTLNKDNHIEWIKDWAAFYRKAHQCDGVLLYDNNSKIYSAHELYDALQLEQVRVVILSWPFKYGVSDWRKPLSTGFGDSLYAQPGMLEHARLRFLGEARSVLNVDVDELVITQNGSSAFELVEGAATGYLEFHGRWVENYRSDVGGQSEAVTRHRDFAFIEQPERSKCNGKWAVVPHRTPIEAQWDIHEISGMIATDSDEWVELRHFRAINTNWNAHRSWSATPRTAHPTEHDKLWLDVHLRAALDKAFGEEAATLTSADESVPCFWSAYSLRVRAAALAAEEQFREAIKAAEDALSLMPEHPGFHLYLAELQAKVGDEIASQKHYSRAHALREQEPWYHFQQGRWQQAEGQLDTARQCFERAVRADPSFTLAYYHLAKVERKLGGPGEALSVLSACLEKAPRDPMAHVHLAEELEGQKKLFNALQCWEAAVSLDPTNPHFHCCKARLLRRVGRIGEAEEVLREAQAHNSLAMQMNRFQERWSIARYLCEPGWHRPTAPELFAEQAELMIAKGDLAAAETAARQALADRRNAPDHYLRLAKVLRLRGEDLFADADLKAGLVNHRTFRERLARLFMESGQHEKAEQVLLGALEIEPQNSELYFRLSQVLKRLKRLGEAVDAARRAIELDSQSARLRDHLAALVQQHAERFEPTANPKATNG